MNHVLGICDSETAYAYQLAGYFSSKRGFPFQVQLFTSSDTLEEYLKKKPLAVALISEKDYKEKLKELSIDEILILGEGEKERQEEFKTIYKYQSSEMIGRQLLDWIAQKGIKGR